MAVKSEAVGNQVLCVVEVIVQCNGCRCEQLCKELCIE
jgi:hypothetical protein